MNTEKYQAGVAINRLDNEPTIINEKIVCIEQNLQNAKEVQARTKQMIANLRASWAAMPDGAA